MKSVLVLLAQGFEEIEAITPIDLLRRAGAKVTVATLKEDRATGAHGITIVSDTTLEKLGDQLFDCVVLPGGGEGAENLAASAAVLQKVIHIAQTGVVSAICAAPAVVLGKTGLLEGKKVTGYPTTEELVEELVFEEEAVVVDGDLITAKGPAFAVDFALAIIAKLFGNEKEQAIRAEILR